MRKGIAPLLAILVLASALGACSVVPRDKTIVLDRPVPSPTATPAPSGALSFQLERAAVIPLDQFDQAGYFAGRTSGFVSGWLDNDHLAATGVKLSAAQPDETSQADSAGTPEKPHVAIAVDRMPGMMAQGVTGQVLSVDWQTGEAVELHTMRDEVVTALGLDNHRERLWYTSIDGEGNGKLSVSDVSFTHELLEVTNFYGLQPFWSSHDKYLCFLSKATLELFDGINTVSVPVKEYRLYYSDTIYLDDSSDRMLMLIGDSLLQTIWNPAIFNYKPSEPEMSKMAASVPKEVLAGKTPRMQWVDSEYLAYIDVDSGGQALQVVGTDPEGGAARYEGVFNFALSDDRKYICLARETDDGMADVIVAEWRDGRIVNEKLVFKGFAAAGNIFFSPDNSKLYIEGSYRYAGKSAVGMVLKFR